MSITDNGIGIPQEYKDKLFEKFFRVPTGDTHNAKGYGLGLSYVAHIIAQHNGTVNIESEEGKGTVRICSVRQSKNTACCARPKSEITWSSKPD